MTWYRKGLVFTAGDKRKWSAEREQEKRERGEQREEPHGTRNL